MVGGGVPAGNEVGGFGSLDVEAFQPSPGHPLQFPEPLLGGAQVGGGGQRAEFGHGGFQRFRDITAGGFEGFAQAVHRPAEALGQQRIAHLWFDVGSLGVPILLQCPGARGDGVGIRYRGGRGFRLQALGLFDQLFQARSRRFRLLLALVGGFRLALPAQLLLGHALPRQPEALAHGVAFGAVPGIVEAAGKLLDFLGIGGTRIGVDCLHAFTQGGLCFEQGALFLVPAPALGLGSRL
jgi:hypothetical protein